jgi:hypothetical protein
MVKLIEYLNELDVIMDEEPTGYRTNPAYNEASARRFACVEECGALSSEDQCTPRAA